jgi:hypothetical protein
MLAGVFEKVVVHKLVFSYELHILHELVVSHELHILHELVVSHELRMLHETGFAQQLFSNSQPQMPHFRIRANMSVKRPGHLVWESDEDQPEADIPVKNPDEIIGGNLPCLVVHPIVGDGRCFWRAVAQWHDDPLREGAYDDEGEPREPGRAQQEQEDADRLRKQVVQFAEDTGLAAFAEGGAAAWTQVMSAPETWADQVAVVSCAAFLRRCILVLAWNPQEQVLYAEKYLEACESVTRKVIPVFYNGINHYELLDEVWLQAGPGMSIAIGC